MDCPTFALSHVERLREAFLRAAYTPDGCRELLGATAHAALSRGEPVPALRATRGGSPLETLVRLFLLQAEVPFERARAALPVEDCLADGWLAGDVPGVPAAVRATVDVRPYGDEEDPHRWVVCDLGCAYGGAQGASRGLPARAGEGEAAADDAGPADLVLGVGGASSTLAGITVRRKAATVLDLGTGSGVQALLASGHAERVTATDLNPRALRLARLTLALSGVDNVDLLPGSLFEPVAGRRFDLIVSNPPFVISPGSRFTYRDGGMAGDELGRTLVAQAAGHLRDGGYCQLLANWEHVEGEEWQERLASWFAPTGCDVWAVQRGVQDPAQYAELWLRDGGDHREAPDAYSARYDAWLEEFERRNVRAVGFGWITLRKSGAERPSVRVEDWPHPVEQPLGPYIEQWFSRQDFLRARDDDQLLASRVRLASGVVQEEVGPPGAEHPEHLVLRQARGMRRATRVDTVGAGFAGACDGTLPAGVILDAIARLIDEDPAALRDSTPEAVRLLVDQGFLEPVG